MRKWEYWIVEAGAVKTSSHFGVPSWREVEAHLNKLGDEGWELVTFDFFSGAQNNWRAALKREFS